MRATGESTRSDRRWIPALALAVLGAATAAQAPAEAAPGSHPPAARSHALGNHPPAARPHALVGARQDSADDSPRTTEQAYALWDAVLGRYVDAEGLVDYAGLQTEGRAQLEAFMRWLAGADPDSFATEAEQVAFWINAYNAVVIWQVVQNYPIDSVRDVGHLFGLVGGFFKREYPIARRQMSADDIEHGTLRARYKDARIHWALVCGAFGCPRLLNRAWRPQTLDDTLTAQAREFLAQPRALQLDRNADTLWLSKYFDWYAEDFEAEAGSVIDYVLRYAPEQAASTIRDHRDTLRVRFLEYDWTLNDQRKGPRSRRPVQR